MIRVNSKCKFISCCLMPLTQLYGTGAAAARVTWGPGSRVPAPNGDEALAQASDRQCCLRAHRGQKVVHFGEQSVPLPGDGGCGGAGSGGGRENHSAEVSPGDPK